MNEVSSLVHWSQTAAIVLALTVSASSGTGCGGSFLGLTGKKSSSQSAAIVGQSGDASAKDGKGCSAKADDDKDDDTYDDQGDDKKGAADKKSKNKDDQTSLTSHDASNSDHKDCDDSEDSLDD